MGGAETGVVDSEWVGEVWAGSQAVREQIAAAAAGQKALRVRVMGRIPLLAAATEAVSGYGAARAASRYFSVFDAAWPWERWLLTEDGVSSKKSGSCLPDSVLAERFGR